MAEPAATAVYQNDSRGILAVAAALSRPAAYRVLTRLAEGTVLFTELEEMLSGGTDWIAVGQLMRAGYATEGRERLHMTSAGRLALDEFRECNPGLPR